ncbi:hypothetical protein E2C01_084585 [Portunus trituberculatus]|uniref:Uncharacterized protein n=1 Tax=Portunus trituberculatus TaxID=210409 RepID=A0A5B7IVR6_PORTR|nr:hypothetical protein [Portunus trituberculatus]
MWMCWLHSLAQIYKPALLLEPQDVVFTKISMHKVASMEHLNHGLKGIKSIKTTHSRRAGRSILK